MGKAYRIKSLAGTGEVYTVIQIRLKHGDIKVQGYGPSINRDYGVSCEIDGDDCPELVEFLEKVASAVVDTKLQVYELDYIEEITGRKVMAQVPDKYGSLLGYGGMYNL